MAHTSPLYRARAGQVQSDLPRVRRAILERDFDAVGELAERDTLMMHAVMLTSQPSLLYWTPETLAVMRAVREWRAQGTPCYFSIDAGPNVHVLACPDGAPEVTRRLRDLPVVVDVIDCRAGPGARRVDAHLF